ncbi:hypothetical protein ADUPG1_006663, partial [Aduncisulcus paluster]
KVKNSNGEIIQDIVKRASIAADPLFTQLLQRDIDGRLPLHFACKNANKLSHTAKEFELNLKAKENKIKREQLRKEKEKREKKERKERKERKKERKQKIVSVEIIGGFGDIHNEEKKRDEEKEREEQKLDARKKREEEREREREAQLQSKEHDSLPISSEFPFSLAVTSTSPSCSAVVVRNIFGCDVGGTKNILEEVALRTIVGARGVFKKYSHSLLFGGGSANDASMSPDRVEKGAIEASSSKTETESASKSTSFYSFSSSKTYVSPISSITPLSSSPLASSPPLSHFHALYGDVEANFSVESMNEYMAGVYILGAVDEEGDTCMHCLVKNAMAILERNAGQRQVTENRAVVSSEGNRAKTNRHGSSHPDLSASVGVLPARFHSVMSSLLFLLDHGAETAGLSPNNTGDTVLHLLCKLCTWDPTLSVKLAVDPDSGASSSCSAMARCLCDILKVWMCRIGFYHISESDLDTTLYREGHLQPSRTPHGFLCSHLFASSLNHTNNQGETPTHIAWKCGSVDLVRLLLSHGACPSIPSDTSRSTLIHEACRVGDDKLLHMVCERKVEGCEELYLEQITRERNRRGSASSDFLSEYSGSSIGSGSLSRKTRRRGGPWSGEEEDELLSSITSSLSGSSSVAVSISPKDLDKVVLRLFDVSSAAQVISALNTSHSQKEQYRSHRPKHYPTLFDEKGYTPLHYAALYGHIGCVKVLVEVGGMEGVYSVKPNLLRFFAFHLAHPRIQPLFDTTALTPLLCVGPYSSMVVQRKGHTSTHSLPDVFYPTLVRRLNIPAPLHSARGKVSGVLVMSRKLREEGADDLVNDSGQTDRPKEARKGTKGEADIPNTVQSSPMVINENTPINLSVLRPLSSFFADHYMWSIVLAFDLHDKDETEDLLDTYSHTSGVSRDVLEAAIKAGSNGNRFSVGSCVDIVLSQGNNATYKKIFHLSHKHLPAPHEEITTIHRTRHSRHGESSRALYTPHSNYKSSRHHTSHPPHSSHPRGLLSPDSISQRPFRKGTKEHGKGKYHDMQVAEVGTYVPISLASHAGIPWPSRPFPSFASVHGSVWTWVSPTCKHEIPLDVSGVAKHSGSNVSVL